MVLVIDNSLIDGSQVAVSKKYSWVRILESRKNIGYVKAVNQGIEYGLNIGEDYIRISNNDVTVDAYSLDRLIKLIKG